MDGALRRGRTALFRGIGGLEPDSWRSDEVSRCFAGGDVGGARQIVVPEKDVGARGLVCVTKENSCRGRKGSQQGGQTEA